MDCQVSTRPRPKKSLESQRDLSDSHFFRSSTRTVHTESNYPSPQFTKLEVLVLSEVLPKRLVCVLHFIPFHLTQNLTTKSRTAYTKG